MARSKLFGIWYKGKGRVRGSWVFESTIKNNFVPTDCTYKTKADAERDIKSFVHSADYEVKEYKSVRSKPHPAAKRKRSKPTQVYQWRSSV